MYIEHNYNSISIHDGPYLSLRGETEDQSVINGLYMYLLNNESIWTMSVDKKFSCWVEDPNGVCRDMFEGSRIYNVSTELPIDDSVLIDDIMKCGISWIAIESMNYKGRV